MVVRHIKMLVSTDRIIIIACNVFDAFWFLMPQPFKKITDGDRGQRWGQLVWVLGLFCHPTCHDESLFVDGSPPHGYYNRKVQCIATFTSLARLNGSTMEWEKLRDTFKEKEKEIYYHAYFFGIHVLGRKKFLFRDGNMYMHVCIV